MAAFFQDLHRTLSAGVVLLVIIILVGLLSGQLIRFDAGWWRFFIRWLHFMTDIMWVGLLSGSIWPNQKKALGIVEASLDEKAGAGAPCRLDIADQNHVLDPNALLHGGATKCRAVRGEGPPDAKGSAGARWARMWPGSQYHWIPYQIGQINDCLTIGLAPESQ
jgi:hypothetical protein